MNGLCLDDCQWLCGEYVCVREKKNLGSQFGSFWFSLCVCVFCFVGLEVVWNHLKYPPPSPKTCIFLRVSHHCVYVLFFSYLSLLYIACASRRPFLAVTHLKFIAKDQTKKKKEYKKKKTKRIERKPPKKFTNKEIQISISNDRSQINQLRKQTNKKRKMLENIYFYYWNILCSTFFFCVAFSHLTNGVHPRDVAIPFFVPPQIYYYFF